MIRWVESAKALDQWKAQIFRHVPEDDDAQRHAYFRLIQQYDQIADVLIGRHYDPWLFHLLSQSLRHAPRVKNQRSVVMSYAIWPPKSQLSWPSMEERVRSLRSLIILNYEILRN